MTVQFRLFQVFITICVFEAVILLPSSTPHSTIINQTVFPSRPNIVEEDPNLDVGPLLESQVELGENAELVCIKDHFVSDGSKLILWYKRNTTRPFISFDSRLSSNGSFMPSAIPNEEETQRYYLESMGNVLVIKSVQFSDKGEYRCTVHFPKSPSITRRLLLKVVIPPDEVRLLDAEERPLGSHIGPFVEGSHLEVICEAQFSCHAVDIEWLLNGEPLSTKWLRKESNAAKTNIVMILKGEHAHAILTCRFACGGSSKNDTLYQKASTTILMFYVPQVTLIVDAFEREENDKFLEKALHVTEGQAINFICAVKARPKPYSYQWFHNGRNIQFTDRIQVVHNTSLIISNILKEDTGLYTCLASNSQGDGQSNAINIKVAHVPYCDGDQEQNMVAVRYVPITLECRFNAQPDNIKFSWTLDPPHPTEELTTLPQPAQTYNTKAIYDSIEPIKSQIYPSPTTYTIENENRISYLKFFPINDGQGVVCMGTNDIGRSKIPCTYKLKVVDPPRKPSNCKTINGPKIFKVSCNDKNSSEESKGLPGISFVVSPEAKTTSHLEIWQDNRMKGNFSSPVASWVLKNLTELSGSLKLKLYKSTPYARSEVIDLVTNISSHSSMSRDYLNQTFVLPADPNDFESDTGFHFSSEMLFVAATVTFIGCLFTLLLVSLLWLRKKIKRKSHRKLSQTKSDVGSVAGIKSFTTKELAAEKIDHESVTKL